MKQEYNGLIEQLGNWSLGMEPLYRLLAGALKKVISRGDLPQGTALPPERELAQALAVSRTTVVAAYDLLRQESWVTSRQGSGTWVRGDFPVATALNRPQTQNPLYRLMAEESLENIDFSLGITPANLSPNLEALTFSQEELAAILAAPSYSPTGISALREALAEIYTENGIPTGPDNLLITNGAQQAIHLIAGLLVEKGDTVLVENPTYFGALSVFNQAGARLVGIPVEEQGLSLALLEKNLATTQARFTYVVPTFQNPTGIVLTTGQRQRLAELAGYYNVPLVEDTTLAELEIDRQALPPVTAYDKHDQVLTIGSLSKLYWGGLRVGWIRANPAIITRLARLKIMTDLGTGIINQVIATRLLRHREEVKSLRRQALQVQRDLLLAKLAEYLPDWQWNIPGGGLFLWVKLPFGNGGEFAQLALRYGVTVAPGATMSVGESHADYLRLTFLLEPAQIEEGVRRLAEAWQAYRNLRKLDRPVLSVLV